MAHTHARILVHIIFSTRHREPMLSSSALRDELFRYLGGVANNVGARLLAAGGVADHIHLLVAMSTTPAIADVVRDLKANSSRWLREKFPDMRTFAWQSGYGVFSVGESGVEDVVRYIQTQEAHHARMTFEEEYLAFLAKHRVEYDPKWVFND